MKNIQKIHGEAMDLAEKADIALSNKDLTLFKELTVQALKLESEAAYELTAITTAEPTRSILFRSAAHLANSIGEYAEARKLVELALSGKPFPETINELLLLQKEIEKGIEKNYSSEEAIKHCYAALARKNNKETTDENPPLPEADEIGTKIIHLYTKYCQALQMFAYQKINKIDVASDIVQEVFIKIIENPSQLSKLKKEHIRSYLFILTKNECIKYIREEKKSAALESTQNIESPTNKFNFLSPLPEILKSVFTMLYLEGRSYKEAASLLNISVEEIRSHKIRLQNMLISRLKQAEKKE